MKYLKITTKETACEQCEGRGWFWDKEYHNQIGKAKCYKCAGTGKVKTETMEDVTDYVTALEQTLNDLSTPK